MVGFSDGARTANTLKENSTLKDLINSIDNHIAGAQDILARVNKLADQVGGPVPRDAGEAKPDGPPEQVLVLRLRRKLAALGSLQAAAAGELSRLENAV